MSLVLIVIVLLIVFGGLGLPQLSGHSYGYWPSGGLGLVLLVLLILLLSGRL